MNKFSFRLILGYRPESLAGFPLENLGHDAQGALRGHEKSIACDWKRVGTITSDWNLSTPVTHFFLKVYSK